MAGGRSLAIPIVLSARWLSVAGIIGPLSWVRAQSKGAIPVLTWGRLRGGISVAMALSLPANDSRSLVADPHVLRGGVLNPCPRLDSGPGDPDDQRPNGGPSVFSMTVDMNPTQRLSETIWCYARMAGWPRSRGKVANADW